MYTAYLDCFSGISGDMFAGALIDMGLTGKAIENELAKLPLEGYSLSIGRTKKHGIDCASFKVNVLDDQKPRDFKEIREMLENSSLEDRVIEISVDIFTSLARAEGKVHGIESEKVHFHEVGAVDSIIDIVVASLGIVHFDISNVISSKVVTGRGIVRGSHGPMPVPAPATAELLRGIPFESADITAELTTPTGAAIIKTLCSSHGDFPCMGAEIIGYGAGDMDLADRPNMLRIFLMKNGTGKSSLSKGHYENDMMLVMETAIDDMNPQFYEPLMEELYLAGCVDVLLIPVQMKKGRPGTMLQALLPVNLKAIVADVIFNLSTTIGIRYYSVARIMLARREDKIKTSFGEISVKIIDTGEGRESIRPEYEDLKNIAKNNNLSLLEVEDIVKREISDRKKDCP